MKKLTEPERNPFPYTDSNKRYHTYNYYLRRRYGGKCVKIPLDGGFSCPNIDGRAGVGGCIYCSARGSGDFTFPGLPVAEQFRLQRERMGKKWETARCIPYLQSNTNTYAPIERLRSLYREVLSLPDCVAFHIATRADCLPEEVVALLAEISEKIDLTVELGLQSVSDATAKRINRGHTYADFLSAFGRLRASAPRVRIAVHLIDGLPGEDRAAMIHSAVTVGKLMPDEIKFHLLDVLRQTELHRLYEAGEYLPLEKEVYTEILVSQIERLDPRIVISRVTGDAPPAELVAPQYTLKKFTLMNAIDKEFVRRDTYQGKFLFETNKNMSDISTLID